MAGRGPLKLVIVVRIHLPEPRGGAPRLVLGMLLQSIAARFDPEAPHHERSRRPPVRSRVLSIWQTGSTPERRTTAP